MAFVCAPRNVAYQTPSRPINTGHVPLEWLGPEVLVDVVEPGEHRSEGVGADRDHQREPDRGVHRVAATDPVPEPEHVRGVDAEGSDLLLGGRDRHEVARDRAIVAEPGDQPIPRAARVRERLDRAERLRRDDEQRRRRVEVARGLGDVGTVDVRDEAVGHRAVDVVTQRLHRHLRPEVAAADADVHHGAHPLAGVARPVTRSHALGERAHAIEDLVHLGHDVASVDLDARPARGAQGHVHDGAILRDVDPLAGEHRLDALTQARSAGERQEQLDRLVGHHVLRVVEEEVAGFGREPLRAVGIVGEQPTQVRRPHHVSVRGNSRPLG